MTDPTQIISRIERLTGFSLARTSARVRQALGLDKLERELANPALAASRKVQRKLERLCGFSVPPARRQKLYRAFGIDQLEERLLLTTITWDGGGTTTNWSDAANWSTNTVPTATDDVVFDGTSLKNVTVNGSNRTVQSLQITNAYSGTITLATGLTVSGSFSEAGGTFNAANRALRVNGSVNLSGGSFVASSGTTTFGGSVIVAGAAFNANAGTVVFTGGDKSVNSGAASFNNVRFNLGAGGDLTVVGTMDVNGNLAIQGNRTSTLAAGNVTVAGNLTTTNSGFTGLGTLILDGAGNQNFSGNGRVGNVTVNKASGTLTLRNTITVDGNWVHTAGTVNAGTSTVVFTGGDKTVSATGMSFNNVTLNLGAGGDLSVVGTMDVNGNLVIQGSTTSTLAGGTVTVARNLTTTNTGFTGAGTVVLDGTGNQNFAGTGSIGNVRIQKSAGTLTLQNTITATGDWQHVSGTVNAGTSTVIFTGGDKTVSTSGMAFNNVTLNLGAGGDLSVVGTMDVNGNLVIQGSTTSTLAGGTVTVAGNLTTTNTGFTGAGTIVLDGTGNQNFAGTGSIGNVRIQKSAGTLTLQNTITATGDWQHVSGTVNAGTSTVVFVGDDKTVSASGMSFNNVTLNLGAGGDLSVVGTMDVNGSLVIQGSTTSTLAAGTITAAGAITNTNSGFGGAGVIVVDGTGNQTLSAGGGAGQFSNLTIQKTAGTLTAQAGITVSNLLNFLEGTLAVSSTLDVNGNMSILGSSAKSLSSGTVLVAGNLTTTDANFA
ncbi:MAG: beta strand repeat-containing protein, partial [Planctomycetaceae bacterium]